MIDLEYYTCNYFALKGAVHLKIQNSYFYLFYFLLFNFCNKIFYSFILIYYYLFIYFPTAGSGRAGLCKKKKQAKKR